MKSYLESHRLPQLFVRGPGTTGPLDDVPAIRRFREKLLKPSGVSEPTTLVIDLEGRFPSSGVLVELIVPLANAVKSGISGPLALIVCTQDESVRTIIRALAESNDLPIYIAPSSKQLHKAEAVGPLTPTEQETLHVLHELGGRASVSTFAEETGLESNAATNRLVSVMNKGFIKRIERSGRQGQFFLDPRSAQPIEDDIAQHPSDGDYGVPKSVRSDVRSFAEMQVLEPGETLANAFQEFFAANQEYLSANHEKLVKIVSDGDATALSEASRRFTAMQIEASKARRQR